LEDSNELLKEKVKALELRNVPKTGDEHKDDEGKASNEVKADEKQKDENKSLKERV
jgi:hypothetical protein